MEIIIYKSVVCKMPPKDGIMFQEFQYFTECVIKFSESKVALVNLEESSETRGHEEIQERDREELEEEHTNRVTTRARRNYELHRYSKNAMLIVTLEPEAAYWTRLITDLKRTFESFRFEVAIAIVPDTVGLYAACEQFLLMDYTDYGAVALVIVTNMAVNKCTYPYPNCDELMFFEESKIVENFRLDRNPTLENKPKIYITEANRRSASRSYHDVPYFDEETYGDALGFHVPLALPDDLHKTNLIGSYDRKRRPLKMLCDRIVEDCGSSDLSTIMEGIVQAAKKGFPLLAAIPIEVMNNLREELFFFETETR